LYSKKTFHKFEEAIKKIKNGVEKDILKVQNKRLFK